MGECVFFMPGKCMSGLPHYENDEHCKSCCPHLKKEGPPEESDHTHTPLPVCPYCGYADKEWWDAGEWGHNERSHSCPRCEKSYKAIMEPNPRFSTYPEEEEKQG